MPGMPGNVTKGPIIRRLEAYVNAAHNVNGVMVHGAREMLRFYEEHDDIGNWLDKAHETAAGGGWGILRRQGDRDSPNNVPPENDRKHIRRHWFGMKGSNTQRRKPRRMWWPKLNRMDHVFQDGLKHALRLCLYDLERQSGGSLTFNASTITRDDGRPWQVNVGETVDVWGAADAANNTAHSVTGVNGNVLTVATATANALNDRAVAYPYRANILALDVYWICAGSHYEFVACESEQQITLMILTPSVPFSHHHGYFGPPGGAFDREKIWVSKTASHEGPGEVAVEVPRGGNQGVITVQMTDQDIQDTHDEN